MVGFDRSTQWMVGWLTPWSVPTMTVPPPLALKQQVKRKRRMNRTIRRKAGLSCGIIPEALFIITARRAPSHRGLFRLPLAGSTQIKLAFCRTKTGQRWRRLFVFHSHPGIYLPGKHFFATNTRNTIFLRAPTRNTVWIVQCSMFIRCTNLHSFVLLFSPVCSLPFFHFLFSSDNLNMCHLFKVNPGVEKNSNTKNEVTN